MHQNLRSYLAYAGSDGNESSPLHDPVEVWSPSLKNALCILLNASCPMFLVWGRDRILFYNDAYYTLLQENQRCVPFGEPIQESGDDAWNAIRSDVEHVFAAGQPRQRENEPFFANGNGHPNTQSFTWSYSAIWDETGQIGGVFATGCSVVPQHAVDSYDGQTSAAQSSTAQFNTAQSSTAQTNTNQTKTHQTRPKYPEPTLWRSLSETIIERKGDVKTIRSLLHISEKLNSTLNVDDLLDLLIEETITLMNAEGGCSGLCTPAGMVCHTYFRNGERLPLEYCWQAGQGLPGWLLLHKVPYLTNDVATDPQIIPELCHQFGVRSALCTPILTVQGEVLGFFEIHNKKDDLGFTPADQETLVAVSQVAAIAIQNAISYQQLQCAEEALQRREEELSLITNVVPVLIAYIDQDHCYRFVNQTYETWFGKPTTHVMGKPVREVIGAAAYESVLPYIKQALSGQEASFESQILYKEGKTRYVSASYIPHINHQGIVEGFIGLVSDISERRRVEAALQESTAILNAINQTSPTLIFVKDRQGRVLMANPSMLQAIGKSDTEVIGKTDREFYHNPNEADQLMENDRLVMRTGQVHVFEETLELAYGKRTYLSSKSPYLDAHGNIIGLIGIAFDITDRKHAEEALRDSADRLSVALNAAKLGDWSWDAATDLVNFSERAAEIFGIPSGPYMTWTQMRNLLHEDDQERASIQVEQAIVNRSDYDIEYRVIQPNGTERWVAAKGRAQYAPSGQVLGMLGVVQDITARKHAEEALRESEERYRYLAESIPQLVWTANAEGVLIDANQRWLDFTGLTLEQAQTEGWQAVVYPDDVPILYKQWDVAQRNGTYYQAEGRMRRSNGEYRWHLHQAIPMKNEQGHVIKWFGTATDIENQKQLEQQHDRLLQQEQVAREEAEQANRIKDEFLAVLSHELRSPLNPIMGWAKLLQTRKLNEQATQRALETIERNAKLQTQLIEDLLDVSRILRGKMNLNVSPVHLVTVVQAAIETVRLAAEAKQIEIKSTVASDVGQVSGDAARLQQIVWNLLSNAIKFTPSGGQVDIRLEQVGTQAQIQVKDTGKGINPTFLPHVFEYFRQEDGTTTRRFGGLGLGLAIVRHLTELHGGTVQVESPGEGLGATFTVSIPLMSAPANSPQEPTLAIDTIDLSGLRVLVVDDEADMRDLVGFILTQQGAEVNMVTSALDALVVLDQFKPDVLISDIGMPVMDGYMLMRQVRARSPERGGQVPAIALTAYAGELDQQQALQAGFQRHIAKPIDPSKLVQIISTLVGREERTIEETA